MKNTSGVSDSYGIAGAARLKDMWDSLQNGFFQETHTEGATGKGSLIMFFGYKHNNSLGSAIIFSYEMKRPAYIYLRNGNWGEPITL